MGLRSRAGNDTRRSDHVRPDGTRTSQQAFGTARYGLGRTGGRRGISEPMSVDVGGNGSPAGAEHEIRKLDRVVIRFAGDSGDGMQLTGDRFTSETAQLGNDISTLPNFPAEIRAPAGTLPGVSSFQVHFADFDILTPGDAPNVLVAMNPAA